MIAVSAGIKTILANNKKNKYGIVRILLLGSVFFASSFVITHIYSYYFINVELPRLSAKKNAIEQSQHRLSDIVVMKPSERYSLVLKEYVEGGMFASYYFDTGIVWEYRIFDGGGYELIIKDIIRPIRNIPIYLSCVFFVCGMLLNLYRTKRVFILGPNFEPTLSLENECLLYATLLMLGYLIGAPS